MESGKSFEEELKKFYEVFADDGEIIQLVGNLVNGTNETPDENDSRVISTFKKYLKKIAKIKKIDKKELSEVSGYVLSSVGG